MHNARHIMSEAKLHAGEPVRKHHNLNPAALEITCRLVRDLIYP